MFTLSAGFLGGPKSVLISTWDTEKLGGTGSATKVLLLPMTAGNTIDWGDGTINNLNTHTYASGGVKTVKIFGKITGFRFNLGGDKLKITDVSDVGGLVIDDNAMFYGCANLIWTATNAPIITTTSHFSQFRDCSLFTGKIGNWPMSLAQDITGMLLLAAAWDEDISPWDVSSITAAGDFLNASGFTATNYDLLLPAWDAQSVQNNVSFHAGSATYGAGAPATAHANLIADHTWTITDGGPT